MAPSCIRHVVRLSDAIAGTRQPGDAVGLGHAHDRHAAEPRGIAGPDQADLRPSLGVVVGEDRTVAQAVEIGLLGRLRRRRLLLEQHGFAVLDEKRIGGDETGDRRALQFQFFLDRTDKYPPPLAHEEPPGWSLRRRRSNLLRVVIRAVSSRNRTSASFRWAIDIRKVSPSVGMEPNVSPKGSSLIRLNQLRHDHVSIGMA